jgi:hypothetical protein
MAARYWTNTTGAVLESERGWLRHVDKIRDPAGDTQTLDPRPRPATWTVAVAVKPFGSRERSLVFLNKRSAGSQLVAYMCILL